MQKPDSLLICRELLCICAKRTRLSSQTKLATGNYLARRCKETYCSKAHGVYLKKVMTWGLSLLSWGRHFRFACFIAFLGGRCSAFVLFG